MTFRGHPRSPFDKVKSNQVNRKAPLNEQICSEALQRVGTIKKLGIRLQDTDDQISGIVAWRERQRSLLVRIRRESMLDTVR